MRDSKLFADTIAFAPRVWGEQLTPALREVLIAYAATFLDETHEPDALQMDLDTPWRLR